jgi:hypothetical protein
MNRIVIGINALLITSLFAMQAHAQAILGHELELEAEPIRENEQPVIPLDKGDPSYNFGANSVT